MPEGWVRSYGYTPPLQDTRDGNTAASCDGFIPVKRVCGAKRGLVYALSPPPTRPRPLGRPPLYRSLIPVVPYSHTLWSKSMSTEVQHSPIDDLTAFATQLGELRADQNPDDLSNALRAAFEQRGLYDAYISSLIRDSERVRVLLEVFDKVRCVKYTISQIYSHHRCPAQALQATTCDLVIFKRVRQLCGWTGLLPTSHTIPGKLIQTTEHPIACGGYADVWEGIYDDKRVVIKALRVYKNEDVQKIRKVIRHVFPIPLKTVPTIFARCFARR